MAGYKYVGGLIGESNESIKIHLLNCTNNAAVTSANVDAGGMLGNVGSFYACGCINSGAVTANRGGAGGISGYHNKAASVKNSKNTGEIIGYDCAGGISGRIESDSRHSRYTGNENTGNITATTKGSAGGIVGWTDGGGSYVDNKNSGNVLCTAGDKERTAGGILGGNEDDPILLKNNENRGTVKGVLQTGGIAGYLGDKDLDRIVVAVSNRNSGAVTSTSKDAGGIIGSLGTDNAHHEVNFNENTGSVSGQACAGGIIGWMAGGGTFDGNTNRAKILSQANDAGGLVGRIEDDKCEFKNSEVYKPYVCTGSVPSPRATADYDYVIRSANSDKSVGKLCGWDGRRKATVNSDTLIATIFGDGNVWILVGMVGVLLAAAVVLIAVKKKKQSAAGSTKEAETKAKKTER